MKKKWMNVAIAGMVIATLISGCGERAKESELSPKSQAVEQSDKKKDTNSSKPEKEEKTITLSNGRELDFPYTDSGLGFKMMVLSEERYNMPIDSNVRFYYGGTDRTPESVFMIGPYKYQGNDEYSYDAKLCDLEAIKGPEDILDNMAYKIPMCYDGLFKLQNITKESEEQVTIGGGFEGIKWKGDITVIGSAAPKTYAYVAYGFVGSDGRPYLFAGTDFTKERKQIDFLEEAWDAMLTTFVENPLPEGIGLKEVMTFRNGEWKSY